MRDLLWRRRHVENAYLKLFRNTKNTITLVSAYFLPRGRILRALFNARKRGVRVVLILGGKFEYFWVGLAARALYPRLLKAGFEIFEYQSGIVHAKVALCDQHAGTVGSSNLEPLSLVFNHEANIFFDSHLDSNLRAPVDSFAETLRLIQIQHCVRISPEAPRSWTLLQTISYYLVYRILRIVLYWLFPLKFRRLWRRGAKT